MQNKQAKWSYSGDSGPENWQNLSDAYSACGCKYQSPVNIPGDAEVDETLPELQLNYQKAEVLNIVNNGNSVQINYPPGSTFNYKGLKYELKQFHFHMPGEHIIAGKKYAMEAHFVHLDQAGNIAVIGLMYQKGDPDRFLASFWDYIPSQPGFAVSEPLSFDVSNTFSGNKSYYAYQGSLTTPPCSEGVEWILVKTPLTISSQQIETIKNAMPLNNVRPVQPLNNRKVKQSK
jgi:carbonic anhydrase